MTKKFTEEQYKKLVKIQEKYFPIAIIYHGVGGESPYDAISETDIKLSDFIWDETLGNEAVAIMNPRTREWAHKQFVEKEKKFYWTNKKNDKYGVTWYLTREVAVVMMGDHRQYNGDEQLTESEVREWGYNPEMFDKEEV